MEAKIYRWEQAFAEQISAGKLLLTSSAKGSNILVPDVSVPLSLSASLDEIVDLYPIETILMTAGKTHVNQNDVMFLIEDTLAAKNTPINKPLNMNHEDIDIVGHITGSCIVDDNYNTILDESNLPCKIHVKTSAVVYRHWRNQNRKELVETLIEEIGENKWFVSMECLFFNFDYAVKEKSGVYNIVQRCDDTSYLTKYLRSFGGDGECDGCRVVMVPRNFIFSGKGFTKNPANLESIIINKAAEAIKEKPATVIIPENVTKLAAAIDVIQNKCNCVNTCRCSKIESGVIKMDLEKQVAELKVELDAEKAKAVKAETLKAEAETKLSKAEARIVELDSTEKVTAELVAKLKEDLANITAEKSKLEETVTDLQAKKLESDRVSTLVSAGVSKTDAVEFAKSFANVSDEQFGKIVAIKLEAQKKPADKPVEETASQKPAKTQEPELEVEPKSTPSLALNANTQTKDIINSAVAYMQTRKILGK